MSELKHYGILRKSGRYPWGSGEDAYRRSLEFYSEIDKIKTQNPSITSKEIATAFGLSIADLRDTTTIAKEQKILEETNRAVALKEKDWSIEAIATNLGIPSPTVRLRLKNSENMKESSLRKTAEVLRQNVDKHEIVDIGKGVSHRLQISPERLRAAASVLRDEGYVTYNVPVRNVGTKHSTNQMVMVKPNVTFGEARKMTDRIHTMGEFSEDGGQTYFGIHSPISISSKRLMVRFAEDGGTEADGHIYVRPGVPDLDFGKNNYAQVRIAVDGTHYIKGMALPDPNLPKGVDIVFNTNKSRAVGKLGALKPMERTPDGQIDPDNPFGSLIKRQIVSTDAKTGKEKVVSALNMVNEEGDWDVWRRSMPSQVLAKQPHSLIKSQLLETRKQTQARIDEINSITNPVVRRKKLEDFADQIDSDAVDLRAAAMPGQKTQVLVSIPEMRKGEVYAPQFKTGDKVALIRFPHGGRFEIPEAIVNNNNRTAKKRLGNAFDAIGIHPSVAEKLSGADFDGDAVVVVPNKSGAIKGIASLGRAANYYQKEFDGFDPKIKYGGYQVVGKRINKKGEEEEVGNFRLMKNTGLEMGMVTNLITDMQIQGAKPEHVVRAVKHSMVVIDAEKHKLNYKQSEIDNGIRALKTTYQGTSTSGAKTLLSRATAEEYVPDRKLRSAKDGGPINPKTGELVYVGTGKTRNVYDPKTQTYTEEKVGVETKVKRLALTNDAFTLARDKNDPVERMYAEHANAMKAMANQVRLQAVATKPPLQNKAAKQVYASEIKKLQDDLREAIKQKPLDRRADVLAGAIVKQRRAEDPHLRTDRDRLQKVERQAKAAARQRLGLSKPVIEIDDRQWDAIQSGGVSASVLRQILDYADPKKVEALALPRVNTVMTSAISGRAKAMLAAGATNADVAAALGIPASTLRDAIRRGDV